MTAKRNSDGLWPKYSYPPGVSGRLSDELAQVTAILYKNGNTSPTYAEIHRAYKKVKGRVGAAAPEVRFHLKAIRRKVEKQYGLSCCLVGEHFYRRYKRKTPKTEAEASQCLAAPWNGSQYGYGMGVYFPTGKSGDRIYREYLHWVSGSGAKKVVNVAARAAREMKLGRMKKKHVDRLIYLAVKDLPAPALKNLPSSAQKAITDARKRRGER